MVQAPAYAPGTPIWVDLASPDLEASKAFYRQVFGWDAQTVPAPEAGGYTFFTRDGKVVAGLGPIQGPGQPPAWSTYVATDDADATARAVVEAGGQVIAPPFDVLDQGRMGVFVDATGAFISVWQPYQMFGAELVGEPGGFCWTELATPDVDAAKAFYRHVFGWDADTQAMGDFGSYTQFQLGGRPFAGGRLATPHEPPHWLVYFAVEDCDATAATVQALGGQLLMPPMDSPGGRIAIVTDPHGAPFGLVRLPA